MKQEKNTKNNLEASTLFSEAARAALLDYFGIQQPSHSFFDKMIYDYVTETTDESGPVHLGKLTALAADIHTLNDCYELAQETIDKAAAKWETEGDD